MTTGLILALALLLDGVFGEPNWLWRKLPHPAILMGRAISVCEQTLNTGVHRKLKGVGALTALILGAAMVGWVLSQLGPIIEILVTAILLAQRSLVEHVRAVADGLRLSLRQGRRAVAMIVSRDTTDMTETAVARSAIESAAENLSDGVVAPAMWFLVAGLPGILVYKVVNTADSMIGYRTERYVDFGWAAARCDDLLNWIPSRTTAALLALPSAVLPQWGSVRADAALHRSPNAGWPEAVMARAINAALAGPRVYDGELQAFAWVHPSGRRQIGPKDIDAAVERMWQAWAGLVLIATAVGLATL